MVRAPITDIELRLAVIPLNDIGLSVPAGLIRISLGLEDKEDLINDIANALKD